MEKLDPLYTEFPHSLKSPSEFSESCGTTSPPGRLVPAMRHDADPYEAACQLRITA